MRDEPLDDEDVAQERNAMRNENDADLALAVRELYKFYGKKTCAVRNLTFGVKPKDCFGLLGVFLLIYFKPFLNYFDIFF